MNTPSLLARKLIVYGTIALLLLAILHIGAMMFDIYYIVWWYDIFMHGFGGVVFGFLIIGFLLFFYGTRGTAPSTRNIFLFLVLGMLVVTITWELLEYAGSLFQVHTWMGMSDSIQDIIMGHMGAFLVFLRYRKYFPSSL